MADETTNEIWFGLDGRQITESSADSGIYTVKNASCVKNTETIIRDIQLMASNALRENG